MKKVAYLFLFGFITITYLYASDYAEHAKNVKDWRKTGTPEEQLKALVKITPGTHHWMPEIAYRYQSLYWSVQQGKWDFAKYQAQSMEKMIKRVALARVKRAASAKVFQQNVFTGLYASIDNKDEKAFGEAFNRTAGECMACHVKEGFAYISVPPIPPKPNSIVLGYPE